ncbi:MAG: ABC transporter ATP-binding protein [Streptococcaceae bacterium]|jgi:ABC-2 type transport system ATP-binding protein|nr:ABC transporter ATP-binding protein [Streptococcaceae bacterium]
MEYLVQIKNLTKKYGANLVLDRINLELPRGQIVALIGENGAGKSTLINIINNLAQATSGEVVMNISRDKIGVMLQGNMSLSRVKVSESIRLAQSLYPQNMDYTELLRLSTLEVQENQLMTKLSGGQKRRLSFALALAGNPELIFLDEPTTGMDPERRASFWTEVKRLSDEGRTFFITSHYLEELENVADRLLLLKDRRIVFDGTIEQLRSQNAQSEVSFKFSGSFLPKLPAVVKESQVGDFYRLSTSQTNELVRELLPYLDNISNLTIKQNSLENMFHGLMEDLESKEGKLS